MSVKAYVSSVGSIRLNKSYKTVDFSKIDENIVRCPDSSIAKKMIEEVEKTKKDGDTIGGEITCVAKGVPVGWGEPVFEKLHAEIGKAMLSINAVHGYKYGFDGLDISTAKGSEVNDVIEGIDGATKTNFSGGITGGLSNGNDICCEVAFKPVSTILKTQKSINKKGEEVEFKAKGRHDACVVPRAVPVVESMMALSLVDAYLKSKTNKI